MKVITEYMIVTSRWHVVKVSRLWSGASVSRRSCRVLLGRHSAVDCRPWPSPRTCSHEERESNDSGRGNWCHQSYVKAVTMSLIASCLWRKSLPSRMTGLLFAAMLSITRRVSLSAIGTILEWLHAARGGWAAHRVAHVILLYSQGQPWEPLQRSAAARCRACTLPSWGALPSQRQHPESSRTDQGSPLGWRKWTDSLPEQCRTLRSPGSQPPPQHRQPTRGTA